MMMPDTYDQLLADLSAEADSVGLRRLRTATHEAGHVAFGTFAGIEVLDAGIEDELTGFNSIAPGTAYDKQLGYMLVAGYATVGELLGAEMEQENRNADVHDDPASDYVQGLACALNELGHDSAMGDQHDFLLELEGEVRKALADDEVAAVVKEIAAIIYTGGYIGHALILDTVSSE